MTVGFISAAPFELEPFTGFWAKQEAASLAVPYARVGEWRQHRVVGVAGGIGFAAAARAARIVIEAFRPDLLLSVGLCGGLDGKLQVGDVVTASDVFCVDTGRRFTAGWTGDHPVTVVSQDRIASTAGEKKSLRTWGLVVEMEAGSIARAAERAGVSLGCVKAVSDTAKESFEINLNAARTPGGSISALRLLAQVPCRPVAASRELARLFQRSREVSRRLGKYLADCRI